MSRSDTFAGLRLFQSLLSIEDMYRNIMSSPVMGNICLAGALLLFLFTMVTILRKVYLNELTRKESLSLFLKTAIILAIFGNIFVYKAFADLIYGLTEALNQLFSIELIKMKVHLEFLYHEMLNKRLDKINIVNPLTWVAPADVLLSSLFLYFFLMTMYALLTIPSILFCLAIVTGPIMAAFSFADFQFFKNWMNILAVSMFLTLIIDIICKVIENTDMLVLLSETIHRDNPIVIITICVIYSAFVVYALAIAGYLFRARIIGLFRIIFPIAMLECCVSQCLLVQMAKRYYRR